MESIKVWDCKTPTTTNEGGGRMTTMKKKEKGGAAMFGLEEREEGQMRCAETNIILCLFLDSISK